MEKCVKVSTVCNDMAVCLIELYAQHVPPPVPVCDLYAIQGGNLNLGLERFQEVSSRRIVTQMFVVEDVIKMMEVGSWKLCHSEGIPSPKLVKDM